MHFFKKSNVSKKLTKETHLCILWYYFCEGHVLGWIFRNYERLKLFAISIGNRLWENLSCELSIDFLNLCYSWYIIASVVFPIVFYIPKWFELTYEKDVPRACYRMNGVSHCLSEISEKEADMAGKLQVENINKYLLKLMSIFCWSKNDTITEQVGDNFSLNAGLTWYLTINNKHMWYYHM